MPADLDNLKGAVIAFDLDGTLVDTAPDPVSYTHLRVRKFLNWPLA